MQSHLLISLLAVVLILALPVLGQDDAGSEDTLTVEWNKTISDLNVGLDNVPTLVDSPFLGLNISYARDLPAVPIVPVQNEETFSMNSTNFTDFMKILSTSSQMLEDKMRAIDANLLMVLNNLNKTRSELTKELKETKEAVLADLAKKFPNKVPNTRVTPKPFFPAHNQPRPNAHRWH